jgi:hypothetical protein
MSGTNVAHIPGSTISRRGRYPISDMHDEYSRKSDAWDAKGPWRQGETCVDYQVFVCDLPKFEGSDWQSAVARMRALGQCEDNACGVTTVRGSWGFFQIPVRGFPELKVTFFQFTRQHQRRRFLWALANALRENGDRT